jgi:hypothetical protein
MLPDAIKKEWQLCWMTVKMEKGGGGTYSPANQPEMHSYNPANQLAIHFYSESITRRFFKLQITVVGIH